MEAVTEAGGGLAGGEASEFFRIGQGVTRFGKDTNESTLPLDAGIFEAIDFDKGCFPGQEVLAKIHNLGHPARRLVRFEIEGEVDIEGGAAITIEGDAKAGSITSAQALRGSNRTLALGYVKWKYRESGEASITSAEGRRSARVRLIEPTYEPLGMKPVLP